MSMSRGAVAALVAGLLCAACAATPQSSQSQSLDSLAAQQTTVSFLVQPHPGVVYDLELAPGGQVTAVWRGPCGPGLSATCLRGVAYRATWSQERVTQLLSSTVQAGFPRLAPAPSGGYKARPLGGQSWKIEIFGVDTAGRGWAGAAGGTASQPDPYSAIWGPSSFAQVSASAGPGQAVMSAAAAALGAQVKAPLPYFLIGAHSVQWPNSCLGLPSAGTCAQHVVSGWLLTYRSGDDAWWWVRTDQSGARAAVDDGALPVLCGEAGAGCAPAPPTCQACPPAPGPSITPQSALVIWSRD